MTQPAVTARRSPYKLPGVTRMIAALLLTISAALALASVSTITSVEANVAGRVLTWIFRIPAHAIPGFSYVIYRDDPTYVLLVTPECSAVFLVLPFLASAALLSLSRRFPLPRLLAALLFGTIVIVAVNEIRIGLIGASLSWWGLDGYGWSHTIVGSGLSFIGIIAAGAIFYFFLSGKTHPGSE